MCHEDMHLAALASAYGGLRLCASLPAPANAGASGAAGSSLKFWHCNTSSGGSSPGYALNTQADDPHAGPVTCVVMSPAGDAAATTGLEGELRVWSRRGSSSSSNAHGARHWTCRAVATYRGARSLGFPAFGVQTMHINWCLLGQLHHRCFSTARCLTWYIAVSEPCQRKVNKWAGTGCLYSGEVGVRTPNHGLVQPPRWRSDGTSCCA